ncbi:hypothetical protein [Sulfurivermis fontis]|uniref:hypothetical protein n=1 Tax=Sulfurivermis fontis TaxID=1972068 RepID=UPI0011AE910C|nr:hypothetical protein [Sulfurivermis fontis]
MARAERHRIQSASMQQRLLHLTNPSPAEAESPFGPLCALGDGLDVGTGYWLCAEPVHLSADQATVYLTARAESLAITAAEAAALAAEFNALFHADGWQLFAPHPTRWYLRLPQSLQLRTTPPDSAEGRDIWPLRPQGQDGLRLQAALNEIQMLFHASAVNARRRDHGQPTVNSLWLWGGAELPALDVPWAQVQGDDCLLRGIAAQAGIPHAAAGDAAGWLQGRGDGLVLMREELPSLEQHWFAPLLMALRRGELAGLDIHFAATACHYRLDRRSVRRWWRRRHPVAALA